MNFGTAITTVFSKYAVFKGVAARSEYWWFALFSTIVATLLNFLMGNPNNPNTVVSGISLVWSLGTLIPSIALSVRRFHDAGFSGKWLLLYILPMVLTIVAASSAIPLFLAFAQGGLNQDGLAAALAGVAGVLVLPFITGAAVLIFNLVVTLLPSKTSAQGNKYAA